MPAGEITKRFTLHDLFGYMLPGCVYFVGTTAGVLALAEYGDNPFVGFVGKTYGAMDLTSRVVGFVVAAYVIGLLCISIGDLLYHELAQLDEDRKPFLKSKTRTWFRGARERWGVKRWQLPVPVADRLKARVREVGGFPRYEEVELTEKQQLHFAYAHLIQTGRDGFPQLMSGRAAMYLGLAGAFVLIAASLFFALLNTYRTTDLSFCTASGFFVWGLNALIILEWWCLAKVWSFLDWFRHHVVYGFLATAPKTSSKPEE